MSAAEVVAEVWLVDDAEHQAPSAWAAQSDAVQRALDDGYAKWTRSMGKTSATFHWCTSGDPEDPVQELLVSAPPGIFNDPTGISVRHLNVNRPHTGRVDDAGEDP